MPHGQRTRLSEYDKVIALIGPSGSGKTTFMNLATGLKHPTTDGLKPCTTAIEVARYTREDGISYVFLDTPGFDFRPGSSRTTILQMLREWLHGSCIYRQSKKTLLDGVLYFHQITQVRGRDVKQHAPDEYGGLCEPTKVALATTGWRAHDERQRRREEELRSIHWNRTKIARFDKTRESAWMVVDTLLRA